METRSSFGVAFRAFLMLACVAAIPVLAVGGASMPKSVKTWIDDHWPGGASAAKPAEPPPRFQPVPPTTLNPAGPIEQRIPGRAAEPQPLPPQWPSGTVGATPTAVTPAAYHTPVEGAPLPPRPAVAAPPPPPLCLAPEGELARRGLPAAAATGSRDEQFKGCQDRLRQQGATYFLLESWGSQQQLFRFYCKMAIGGNPNCTRHFEATDADPLRAMAVVVEQVDAWRSGTL
jgi:hypothetical protein